MGRSRRSDKELQEVQRLKLENQKLRKQIGSLRKQLSRIDIDRYTHLRDIIEAHEEEDDEFDSKVALKQLKSKWQCHDCGKDYLRLILVPRIDGTFYFRRCLSCGNKTRLKKYTPNVEGIGVDDELVQEKSK